MKNKTHLLIAVLVALAMNVFAQSSNPTILTEERSSLPYHYINIKGEMNVKLVQTEEPGLTVEGTHYQLGNTITMLRNDTLFVYQTNKRKSDGKTLITINVNDLALLEVSGKTKVDCSGLVNTDYLTVRAKDGAQIKLDVRALKVQSEVTGCGIIFIAVMQQATSRALKVAEALIRIYSMCWIIKEIQADYALNADRSYVHCPVTQHRPERNLKSKMTM